MGNYNLSPEKTKDMKKNHCISNYSFNISNSVASSHDPLPALPKHSENDHPAGQYLRHQMFEPGQEYRSLAADQKGVCQQFKRSLD